MRCVTPPMKKGQIVVDVAQALNAGNGTSTSPASINVQPAGVLKSLDPYGGSTKGGGALFLAVSQLHSDVQYTAHIGSVIVDAVIVGTRLKVAIPASVAGNVTVAVSVDGHVEPTQSLDFEYVEPWNVTTTEPSRAIVESASRIHVHGSSFPLSHPVYCALGGLPPQPVYATATV